MSKRFGNGLVNQLCYAVIYRFTLVKFWVLKKVGVMGFNSRDSKIVSFLDVIVPEPNGFHYMNELCSAYGIPVDDIPNMLNSVVEPCIATLPQELGNLKVCLNIYKYYEPIARAKPLTICLFSSGGQTY